MIVSRGFYPLPNPTLPRLSSETQGNKLDLKNGSTDLLFCMINLNEIDEIVNSKPGVKDDVTWSAKSRKS